MKNIKDRNLKSELYFKSSRSGGKGGQNVNKVETKIELNFDVANSMLLKESEKVIIINKLKNRIDSNSILKIVSQTERSQYLNKNKAVKRFFELIEKALEPDIPRIKTKIPVSVKRKRLSDKKSVSLKKELRKIDHNKEY